MFFGIPCLLKDLINYAFSKEFTFWNRSNYAECVVDHEKIIYNNTSDFRIHRSKKTENVLFVSSGLLVVWVRICFGCLVLRKSPFSLPHRRIQSNSNKKVFSFPFLPLYHLTGFLFPLTPWEECQKFRRFVFHILQTGSCVFVHEKYWIESNTLGNNALKRLLDSLLRTLPLVVSGFLLTIASGHRTSIWSYTGFIVYTNVHFVRLADVCHK